MENLSVNNVFNIPEDYTLEQLKKSYVTIIDNLYKSNKTHLEKKLLNNQYKQMYNKGKQMYFDKNNTNEFNSLNNFNKIHENTFDFSDRIRRTYNNPFFMFNNIFNDLKFNQINQHNQTNQSNLNSQVYSYSSSYSSNINPDGSKTIIEKKYESTNGDKKKIINAYKKMPDGKTIPLTENEIKQLEKFSNLQIKN